MFDDKSINIHYRAPASQLLKMNTLNEFELNRIKKFYAQELANRLHRSKSTRLTATGGGGTGATLPNTCYWQTSGCAGASAPGARGGGSGGARQHRDWSVPAPMRQFRASTLEDADQIGADPNVIDLKRYQHALSTKQKSRRSAASQQRQVQHQNQHQHKYQHQPRFGKTLYNFQAKNEGELSLKCGDLVELLDILEGANWARVEDCQSGLQGLVPVTYLDCNIGCALAKRDVTAASWLSPSKSASVSRSSSRQSSLVGGPGAAELLPEIATTGASLAADKLLPMSKGEPIALIRKLSGHLYEASNTRLATGLVWSNDLEIIKQPPPPPGNGGVEATHKTSGSTMGGNGLGRTGRVYPKKSGAAHAAHASHATHAAADYQQQMQMGGGGGGGDDVDAGGECFQDAELDSGNDEENCVHQEGLNVDIYGAAVAAADNDDDDDDDEISRYLNQLQSICTDLGGSKRRQQQHQQYQRFVTLDSNQVPLLVDSSSLAKRRRARSASAALDVQQQQQQQLDQRERDHSSRDQRQQHYRSQTNQRHYEQKRDLLEQTSTTTSTKTKTMMTTTRNQAPGGGQQFRRQQKQQQQQQQPKQYRSSTRYCACCKQEDDNLQHEHEPTASACSQSSRADQIAGRQPARSLSSPHIVAASDRFQQQPEVVAAAPEALQAEPETAPMVTNTNLPRLCRARFAYKPRQRDELELIVGDILVVVQECDDGWFIGSSYTTKQMGTFPGNFVESI